MTTGNNLLTVRSLGMRFGGIQALTDVDFSISAGSISALIGPNGAGKTTVFNCITGFYPPSAGNIELTVEGQTTQDLGQLLASKLFGGSHRIARQGIARTFQNIRLFREMTVLENLLVAQHHSLNHNLLAGFFRTCSYRTSEQAAIDNAVRWLQVVGLRDCANRLSGTLPYGHQRRLEIARAMCTHPRLICLDEPAAGLNPRETEDLAALIRQLRQDHGVTVLLIEHDMGLVMGISDHVVVLDHGRVIAMGTPQAVAGSPAVILAYLGVDEKTDAKAKTP
jgi:branched-chain amino acid transport system ATP-binding protein